MKMQHFENVIILLIGVLSILWFDESIITQKCHIFTRNII